MCVRVSMLMCMRVYVLACICKCVYACVCMCLVFEDVFVCVHVCVCGGGVGVRGVCPRACADV